MPEKHNKIDKGKAAEFNKITTGFTIQRFGKDSSGKFVCIEQEFIAGDDVQFEDIQGSPIEALQHRYQPFNMTLLSITEITDRLCDILAGIDTGGEQSRQFSTEIAALKALLKDLGLKQQN